MYCWQSPVFGVIILQDCVDPRVTLQLLSSVQSYHFQNQASAPAETILKWVEPPGAAGILMGTDTGIFAVSVRPPVNDSSEWSVQSSSQFTTDVKLKSFQQFGFCINHITLTRGLVRSSGSLPAIFWVELTYHPAVRSVLQHCS